MVREDVPARLIEALRYEVDAVRRRKPKADELVAVRKGRLVERTDDGAKYAFDAVSWPATVQPDRGLLIRAAGDEWHPVVGHDQHGRELSITCHADLGPTPISGDLRQDDAASCLHLIGVIERMVRGEGPVDQTRAALVVGRGRPRVGEERRAAQLVSNFHGRLNAAQQSAVARALGSEVGFVWGPPGTGKTEAVAAIAEGALRSDLRVLFVAPTNVAVDQALERICEVIGDLPTFAGGLVQRVGDMQVASLDERFGTVVDPVRTRRHQTRQLDGEIEQLRARQGELLDRLAGRQEADQLVTEAHAAELRSRAYQEHLARGEAEWRAADQRVADLERRLTDGSGGRLLRPGARKVARWEEELLQARTERQRIGEALAGPARERDALARQAQDLHERAAAALRAEPATAGGIQSSIDECTRELDGLSESRKAITKTIAAACRLVATTCARASYQGLPLEQADVVIVDEAGMVDLPTAYILAGLSARTVVFAGDFRQLPAVVHGDTDRKASADRRQAVQDWYAADPFRAAGLLDERGAVRDDPRMVRLDTQYRMRPGICALVNAVAYPDGPLRTGRDDTSAIPPSPLLEAPLVLIDTSDHTIDGGNAYRNSAHAELVREYLRLLQQDGALPARRSVAAGALDPLAVIAPYNQQVRWLNDRLRERFGNEVGRIADTVHRFQGSQRPIVIVDTVTGANNQLGVFFEDTGLQSTACRILNVAVSRARDHVVVLANVRHLRDRLDPASEVRVLLNHLEATAQRVSPDDLIPIRSASELADLVPEDLARPAFFPADETDAAVKWDLTRARARIEIYCAFLKQPRITLFNEELNGAVGRSVPVTVFTRSADETPENRTPIQALRRLGCQVEERDQMHEKVVVVDDVLWMGSLNLFQHTRSTELMMRIASPVACEHARRTVQRAQPTRRAHTPPPPRNGTRTYLNVPYAQKDDAKRLGARWDGQRKKWYVDGRLDDGRFARWLPANGS